jgi:hypothetical protein
MHLSLLVGIRRRGNLVETLGLPRSDPAQL